MGEVEIKMTDSSACPFCVPRADDSPYWIKVDSLNASTLYLDRNQTYRGHCLLVFDPRHTVGMESLAPDEFTSYMDDFRRAAAAITSVCSPDLMNYASLGNVIRHLHWHIVPRYTTDPRWGGPIYTSLQKDMPVTHLAEPEYISLVEQIRTKLKAH